MRVSAGVSARVSVGASVSVSASGTVHVNFFLGRHGRKVK